MTFAKRSNLALLLALTASSLAAAGCGKKDKPADPTPAATETAAEAPKKKALAQTGIPAAELKMPALPEMPIPEDNPQSEAKVELGRQLFFDARLSVDGSVSCYSCHQNEQGNGGATPTAIGAKEKKLSRHSPVIWNVGYLPKLYWDGRADNLEGQAKGAWGGGNMGVGKPNLDKKATEIAAIPGYKKQFEAVFPGEPVTADHIAKAISAYERTLVCNDTAYDKFAAGDKAALNDEQQAGLNVFMGKGMCSACHAPPHFSTAYMGQGAFFNVGVGTKDVPEDQVDVGRMKISEKESDWAAFKPPTLRNVTKSAPYFHDGHVSELEAAVRFMASGGYDNKNKTPLMSDKKLTDEEIQQLLAFLGALECGGQLEKPELP